MTTDQALSFAILGSVIVLLVWGRIRYDLVAAAALLASVAVGLIEPKDAFRGLSDDIVVIVGSALVVSAAVSRSGVVERALRPVTRRLRTTGMQVGALAGLVAVLSAFMKNIGALAMFMPIAFQLARRTHRAPSRLLMPLSFGALLGGMMTLIGTSPNIIVSRLREELSGQPFGMFDFLPVGIGLTVAGVTFLAFGWRLLPRSDSAATGDPLFSVSDYRAEVLLPEGSPFVGRRVADLEKLGEGDVRVVTVIREKYRRYVPEPHWVLFAGDVLVLECDAQALAALVAEARLQLVHDKDLTAEGERVRLALVEAVVSPGSPMIGRTVDELGLRERHGLSLLALSRRGRREGAQRLLRHVRFQPGDLLVIRGRSGAIAEALGALGCLPLAERDLRLGESQRVWAPVVILAGAMILLATGVVEVPVAFFGAAVLILLSGALTIEQAYDAIDWPVLALLAALIPVSDTLRTTGATELLAGWLSIAGSMVPPVGALALLLVAAMAVTPFLNNAATVLVMAPIAGSFAHRLGLNPDPFLMAVAVGAASDFLTPIGHQCNTLVMGPGGYRFSDYWRLGLPLSLMVIVLGTLLISVFWPLR